MSSAQKVADLFDNDGQIWRTSDGRSIDEVCTDDETLRSRVRSNDGRGVKYLFQDGSTLVAMEGGWDFGVNSDPNCFCLAGIGCGCNEREDYHA